MMNDGRLLSSSFDKCLRVWDLEQGQCDFLLKDVFSVPRFMVQISDDTVYAVYFNGLWEVLSLRDVIDEVKDMIDNSDVARVGELLQQLRKILDDTLEIQI